MSRLTIEQSIAHAREVAEKNRANCERNTIVIPNRWINDTQCAEEHEQLAEWLEELKRYKDLEYQGRLIELPCKVGDTVYQITRNFISKFKIKSFVYDNEGFFFYWECISGIYINVLGFNSNKIGKDIFLTPEEAEAKLAEMEGKE